MTKNFQESVKGSGTFSLYYAWSPAANWSGGVAPVAFDDLVATAVGAGSDQQADDIASLTLSSLTLNATATASETVYVGGGLTLGTLTLNSVGANKAMLEATNTFGSTPTVVVNGFAAGSSGVLFSYGAGASIYDNSAGSPGGITYEAANGGLVYLKNAPAASSKLTFYDAGGIIALANPGVVITSALTGVRAGDAIELQGGHVVNVGIGLGSLTLQTDTTTTSFTNVSYSGTVPGNYFGAFDSATGLEKIVLGNFATFKDSSTTIAPAYYSGFYQWSNDQNWTTGDIANAGDVIIFDTHPGPNVGQTFVMDTAVSLADLIVTSTTNQTYNLPYEKVDITSDVTVKTLDLDYVPAFVDVNPSLSGASSASLTVTGALNVAQFQGAHINRIWANGLGAHVNIAGTIAINNPGVFMEYAAYSGGTLYFGAPLGGGWSIVTNAVAGTLVEFANPGNAINGPITISNGISIELPGSTLLYATLGATSLSVVTDTGNYAFSSITHTAPTQVWGMTASHDAATGLEKITFSQNATAMNVVASGAGIVNGSGAVGAGASITLSVYMSATVTVNTVLGSPSLQLSDGGVAIYSGGSGSNILTFTHTVQAGQHSADLAITGFNYNNAVILDPANNPALMPGAAINPAGILRVGATAAANDFNGDGVSDILFRDAIGGDTGFYRLNASGAVAGWNDLGLTSTAYSVVGTGDFNADGIVDVLFRNNSTGDTGYFQMNAAGASTGWHDIGSSSTAYSVVGVGDFNMDGVSDVLFRNGANGDIGFYQLNSNGTFQGWHGLGGSSVAYSVAGVGDFNGDGVSDVLFRNNATGDTGFYQINSNGTLMGWRDIASSSTAYSVVGVGDFNGDGTSDILFRNNATGDTGFYQLNAGAFQGWHDIGSSSTAYSVVGTGDYNGDGVSDVLFRNNATGDTGFYQLTAAGAFQGWHSIGSSSTAYGVVG